ncbi:MAG: hypothetical protein ACOX2W_12620 [Desulfomonilia bacterium]|jgi:hypothetical protein|nr:hypothetical protein [Desulfomonilia bacterium]HPW70154.1 hypothetical protein [Deltaproteobacteria bacterium]
MTKKQLRSMVLAIFTAVFLSACGAESSSKDDSTPYGAGLHTFTEDVQLCTPYLGSSSLDQWADWDPDNAGGVLGRLFDPGMGEDECLYTHSVILDDHIELANRFSDHWDQDGEHTRDGVTMTVDTSVESVVIPYLKQYIFGGMSVAVDRILTLKSGALTIRMAFAADGEKETIVEQYEIGDTEAGVFYAIRDGDHRALWQASVRGARTQHMWEGNVAQKWFRITECTDSGTNWEVMGGGSVAREDEMMAFRARSHEDSEPEDEFYLSISLEELNNGTIPAAGVVDAAVDLPDGVDAPLAYITKSSGKCLGFLGYFAYPNDVDELDWVF